MTVEENPAAWLKEVEKYHLNKMVNSGDFRLRWIFKAATDNRDFFEMLWNIAVGIE